MRDGRWSTRTCWPTTRWPTTREPSATTPSGCCAAWIGSSLASKRRPKARPGPTRSSSSPITDRPRAHPSGSPGDSPLTRSCARPATPAPSKDPGWVKRAGATWPARRDAGLALVGSARHGALAMGNAGVQSLDRGGVEGVDPLALFGVNAARHVKRTDGFAHVADLMVNSAYDPETDEVFAFEEMVGSHGGLGGPQSFPFALVPRTWSTPCQAIVGAEALHQR